MYQSLIDYFKDKTVLILGFGREGISTYNFLREYYPQKSIAVADKADVKIDDKNVTLITGEKYLNCINDYDIVIKTPGISLRDVKISKNVTMTCQMDLFLKYAPCFKIGITGTKGKTTTSTLVYSVIKASGKDACLIGNIGVPVFDSLKDIKNKIAVIEMSCHQLEFCRSSPDIAILTNIYPEHLDHYNGFKGYVNAKLNIVRYQTEKDTFIYNCDQDIEEFIPLSMLKSKKVPVSIHDGEKDECLIPLTDINDRLIGDNNHQDIYFACAAAKEIGISFEAVKSGIKNFVGIPHRLEPVGVFKGIKFYNDSIATIPHSVEGGIEAVGNVETLIFGGMDRGLDYSEFILYLEKSKVKNLIGLPDTGINVLKAMQKNKSKKNLLPVGNMEEAVETAYNVTSQGKTCLFSPAASSYNIYKNFEQKGEHFKSLVKQYGE